MFCNYNEIKLELSTWKNTENSPTTWKLNNTRSNVSWVNEKSKFESISELNENENKTYHNLWDVTKTVLSDYIEKFQNNDDNLYYRKLEKDEQMKYKVSRKKKKKEKWKSK